MFMKPANSDTEKNIKMSPEKYYVHRKQENWKRHFMKCTRTTPKKEDFYTIFLFKKPRFLKDNIYFLAARSQTPLPLSGMST